MTLRKMLARIGLAECPRVQEKWDELMRLKRNGYEATDDFHEDIRTENGSIVHIDWRHEERRAGR